VEWTHAVEDAIIRLCKSKNSDYFTRQELIEKELKQIINETHSKGITPTQTLSRVLQELRDAGEIEFVSRGIYRKVYWPL